MRLNESILKTLKEDDQGTPNFRVDSYFTDNRRRYTIMTSEEAEEMAKKASLENPNDIYYVSRKDDFWYRGPNWYRGKIISREEAQKIKDPKYSGLDNKMTEEDINSFYDQIGTALESTYGLEGIKEHIRTSKKQTYKRPGSTIKTMTSIEDFYTRNLDVPIFNDIPVQLYIVIRLWGDGTFKVESAINIGKYRYYKLLLSGKYDPDTKQIVIEKEG